MVSVNYKSLTALQPVELQYSYNSQEQLQAQKTSYAEGLTVYSIDGTTDFKDISINRSSCFILTSAVPLTSLFVPPERVSIGTVPCTVKFQPRNTNVNYAFYNAQGNFVTLSPASATNFFIYPVGENIVEIKVDGKFLRIQPTYPYQVFLSNEEILDSQLYLQRFYITYQDNLLTLKVKVNEDLIGSEFRYLAFNNDNILRATGCILNDSVLNDYVFKVTDVTTTSLDKNFIPTNTWVTYFEDFESQTNNKTVAINKVFNNAPTNYLIDFPVEEAVNTGKAKINIANLKTTYTPTGGPAPVDNSYEEVLVTRNE